MWNNSYISVDNLPSIVTSDYQPIQKSYLTVLLIRRALLFITILLAGVYSFVFGVVDQVLIIAMSVSILLLFALIILFAYQQVRHQGYLLRQKDISYKKGWINQSFTSVPFNRVQHVEVTQGVIERKLHLATLKVYTAGGSSSDLQIPGITKTQAEKMKSFLLDQMSSIISNTEEE